MNAPTVAKDVTQIIPEHSYSKSLFMKCPLQIILKHFLKESCNSHIRNSPVIYRETYVVDEPVLEVVEAALCSGL